MGRLVALDHEAIGVKPEAQVRLVSLDQPVLEARLDQPVPRDPEAKPA